MPSSKSLQDNIVLLKNLESALAKGGIVSFAAEAETLVRFFGRVNRIDYFTGRRSLSTTQKKALFKALTLRIRRIPLQHLLGETEFCGHRIFVTKDVLIPRPETEKLCEIALQELSEERVSGGPGPEILDLGTGSGCISISLTLARPDSKMTALDISAKALKIARKNIKFHGLGKKIRLLKSDLFSKFSGKKTCWDMIVSNPPYISARDLRSLPAEVKRDPRQALLAGPDGMRVIRKILRSAPRYLKPGGWLLLEIGEGQKILIREILAKTRSFQKHRFIRDEAGVERFFAGKIGQGQIG